MFFIYTFLYLFYLYNYIHIYISYHFILIIIFINHSLTSIFLFKKKIYEKPVLKCMFPIIYITWIWHTKISECNYSVPFIQNKNGYKRSRRITQGILNILKSALYYCSVPFPWSMVILCFLTRPKTNSVASMCFQCQSQIDI